MFSKKNIDELKLTPEQHEKFMELGKKEMLLRSVLKKCKVYQSAIDGIVLKSDLNKVDENNLESLEESIRETWSDFIMKGE